MKRSRPRTTRRGGKFPLALGVLAALAIAALSPGAKAARPPGKQEKGAKQQEIRQPEIQLPPEAKSAIAQIYQGDPGASLEAAQAIERQQPNQPLGYLIEAEARWWQLYCEQSESRYGMVDLWDLPKGYDDRAYLNAARRVVQLGGAELKKNETAQSHLWTGMGYALEARMYGAEGKRMATARAGVKARQHLLRAIALDPRLADADSGLGLYNYYVDTLSPIVKLLRVFLGIPGGNKQQGVEQLRAAMDHGELTSVEARFYLAKNLRTYDHDYAQALSVAQPLAREFPNNPIFLLLIGNLEMELGRKEQAKTTLGPIGRLRLPDGACAERSRQLAQELLAGK